MIPSDSVHLLSQDNAIPGNRKDGFRFHYLLFIIVVTPIYLWFELSFGVALLDTMGSTVVIDDTRNIEHWGRLISGFAIALLLLSGWAEQWERECMPLAKGLLGALGIIIASVVVTWWAQGKILEFYVERTAEEIPRAVAAMAFLLVTVFFLVRLWLRKAASGTVRSRGLWLSLAVIGLLGIGYAQAVFIKEANEAREAQLGIERQRTATLTIIRRGLQEDLFTLPEADNDARSLHSPEGKTYLALFPVFGVMYDKARMDEARPGLIAEFMYRDWQRDYGEQAYAGYQSVEAELRGIYADRYLSGNGTHLGERPIPGGLDEVGFYAHEAVRRYLRMQLGCFDCAYTVGMDREAFGREYFRHARARDVADAVQTFADPQEFETGKNGDRAARTYWAPILALLFSMLGAFTHVFKLLVTLTAYFQRRTFSHIDAADSAIASQVIANSARVTAGAVIALALFTYFYENRITGNPRYIEQRATLWQERPVVGAIAAHWTVNAQSLAYPFTKKLRPEWLSFDTDPVQKIPVVRHWFQDPLYE